MAAAENWYLYILRCADGSLYTGITTDVQRRLAEHSGKQGKQGKQKGAKSLRGKRPLNLVYQTDVASRSEALKLEYRVKQLGKAQKEDLVNSRVALEQLMRNNTSKEKR